MKFRAGELEFTATVADSGEIVSPQTGASLRTLTIQFRAQKEGVHEQALEAAEARQSGGLFSLSDDNAPDLEWRVRESTAQYVGTPPWGVNHHLWRIEQVERLACERLSLGPLDLVPYEYAEAVDDAGHVSLVARATVTETDLTRLSELPSRVDVIRHGISETPRSMHMVYVWGPNRDRQPAVAVRFADASEPRVHLAGVSLVEDSLEDLIDVLVQTGALTEAARTDLRSRRHAARRVADLDGWLLTSP